MAGIAVAATLLAVAALVRIGPQLRRPPSGCDAWYYLAFVRELHRSGRFPVRLKYLMERPEQWYPPIFPLLLSLVPIRWLDRVHWLVAPGFDLLLMGVLLRVVGEQVPGSAVAIATAGVAYVLMPTLLYESQSLTSRPFGGFVTTIALLAAIQGEGPPGLALAALLGAAVLLSHRLSAQFLAFALVVLSIGTRDPRYAVVLASGVVLAIALSGGFYLKVASGHLDALRFWARHHALYTAHQIEDSPLYGSGTPSRIRYYRGGLSGQIRLAARLVAHQPFAIVLLPAWPLIVAGEPFAWWSLATVLAALLTTFVPALRFAGEGHKYVKFGALPLALLAARLAATGDPLALAAIALAALAGILVEVRVIRSADRAAESFEEPALAAVIARIRESDLDRILCIPTTIADRIAYATDRSVFWGGHSSRWDLLEGFYPVLTEPIEDLIRRWGVGGLVVDRTYADPRRLGLDPTMLRATTGRYEIYATERDPSA